MNNFECIDCFVMREVGEKVDEFAWLLELARQSRPAEVLTIVDAPDQEADKVGRMLIITEDSGPTGMLVDETLTQQIAERVMTEVWQQPKLIEVKYNGVYRLFWDRLTIEPKALVLGAGHISQPLVEFLSLVGYCVTVADDRPDFASTVRFPKAKQVICKNFTETLRGLDLANYAAVIIVTRGHRYDLECLRAVIRHSPPYLGMIGSQRRIRGIIDILSDEGVSREALSKLNAPIGLDIGAQTPVEIALSIVAEVLAVSRGRSGMPLSAARR